MTLLQVGQRVLKKDFTRWKRRGGKLDLRFTGPYTIVAVLPRGYKVSSINSAAVCVCGAHLKPYKQDSDVSLSLDQIDCSLDQTDCSLDQQQHNCSLEQHQYNHSLDQIDRSLDQQQHNRSLEQHQHDCSLDQIDHSLDQINRPLKSC